MADVPLATLFAQLGSSEHGLSSAEAQRRWLKTGPNEPAAAANMAGVAQLLRLFLNPLVMILLLASGLSAMLREGVAPTATVGLGAKPMALKNRRRAG